MTREEAISIMNVIIHMLEPQYDNDRVEEAVDMAIKALEQEPCEDAVSRKAVDLLCFEFLRANSDDNCAFYERFRDLPAVTPTHKASGWQQDHAILKAHADGANEVLDRIKEAREEIEDRIDNYPDRNTSEYEDCLTILDKLIAEVEGTK